jgi:hypothetical protein
MDTEDAELSRDIADAVRDTPTWVQPAVGTWTEAEAVAVTVARGPSRPVPP